MTEDSPSLLRLAAPIVISFWMRAAFSLVDTVYAATLGDAAIAAIGLAVPLEFLMIACWVGVSTGLTSALSRTMGAHEGEKIGQFLSLTRRVIMVLSGLFVAIGGVVWLGSDHLGLDPELTRYFKIYATVTLVGSAFTSFWSILPDSVVKAHHDTKATMTAGIWSNVINVTLNTVFLFVLEWGMFGIAFSTVLGRIGGLIYALGKARAHERERIASGRDTIPGLDPAPMKAMLGLAIPAALAYALMSTEGLVINALLARTEEATAAIAAYSVFHRAFLFMIMPVIAITIAMLPFVGRLYGNRRMDEIRQGFRQAMLASGAYVVLLVAPACLAGRDWVARKIADSPATVELTLFSLRFCPLLCLAATPFILCRPMFEGLGRGRPVAVMAVLRYVVLTVPLILVSMHLARRYGYSEYHGLMVGLLTGTLIVSLMTWEWMRRTLAAEGAT